MLDNVDVAVLTKVNELADRHGLKPYDFVATFGWKEAAHTHVLNFECPASGSSRREKRFDNMLTAIGITVTDKADLSGRPEQIIDALDNALEHAPRTRRF